MDLDRSRSTSSFRAPFTALSLLGLTGVAALIPYLWRLLNTVPNPQLPLSALAALSVAQASVLTMLFVALGVATAPRLGFVSRIVMATRGQSGWWGGLRRDLPASLAAGAAAALLLILGDLLFLQLIGEPLRELLDANPRTLELTLQGVLYGGITEELWLRWGVLSGLTFLAWRVILRRNGTPSMALVWALIVVVALLFGLGHLGALSAQADATLLMVTRVVSLNALAGLLFGGVYYRRSLEGAMIAHGFSHVVVTLVTLPFGL